MKVLFVDDNADVRALLCSALSQHGVESCHAVAQTAVESLADPNISLVVVDGELLGWSAFDLIDLIREQRASIPIVLLSDAYEDLESLPDFDVSLMFYKPLDPTSFAERIVRLLPRHEPSDPVDELAEQLLELRRHFASALPGKLSALSEAVALAQDDPDELPGAQSLAHRLHGSAGSYGFAAVGEAVGEVEDLLAQADQHRQVLSTRTFWSEVKSALQNARISASRAPELEAAVPGIPLARGRAILVVDDDPDFLRLVRSTARGLMLEVVTAESPGEAVHRAKSRSFIAAVLDVHLGPDHDAFQLARRIRQTPANEEIPIAFISGDHSIQTRVAATEAGASRFLEKPMSVETLGAALQSFLQTSELEIGRVLIVEDDADTRDMYTRIMQHAGFAVDALPSAHRLVETLDDTKADLLLLDMNLPQMSGIDVCRALRMSERWGLLPVLIITAGASPETRVKAFRAGASDVISKPVLPEELLARVGTQLDRTRLMKDRADKDALTGILTRRALLENLQRAFSSCRRENDPLSVVFLDIDHFKSVNDTRGHLAGDRVLAKLGELMRQRFRIEDLRGRWGGEEFVIAFPRQEREFATHAATNLLDDFASQVFESDDGQEFSVTFTAGIAGYPDDGESIQALVRCADDRLYAGKRHGRNRVMGAGSLSEVSEIWDIEDA